MNVKKKKTMPIITITHARPLQLTLVGDKEGISVSKPDDFRWSEYPIRTSGLPEQITSFLAITSIKFLSSNPSYIRKNKIIKFLTSLVTCRINEKQVMKGNEPPKTKDPVFSIVIIIIKPQNVISLFAYL